MGRGRGRKKKVPLILKALGLGVDEPSKIILSQRSHALLRGNRATVEHLANGGLLILMD